MDITEYIENFDVPLCPLCDQPVDMSERHKLATAHGMKFLVYEDCLEELDKNGV